MPKNVAIGKIVAALVRLDDELLGLDMDHSLRSQYQFIVRNWIAREEGQVLVALLERVAQQDHAGTKARSVLNAIIHGIAPLNAVDHHHHHEHDLLNRLPTSSESHRGLIATPDAQTEMAVERAEHDVDTVGGVNVAIVGHLGTVAKEDLPKNKHVSEGKGENSPRAGSHRRRDTIISMREKQHAQHERIEAELLHTHDRSTPTPDDAEHKKQEQAPTTTKATNKQKGGKEEEETTTAAERRAHPLSIRERLHSNVIDDELELHLLQHMSIEDRQLRPVCIALSMAVLFKTWSKVPRFFHLGRTCQALMRVLYTHPAQHLSVYTTEDPKEYATSAVVAANVDRLGKYAEMEPTPTLEELLASVPYASVVRDLEPQVEALVKQRQLMAQAQVNALARRESRKRAILRTAAKWQKDIVSGYFVQWHNISRTLKQQRTQLVKHFLNMHTASLKDIFDAWHIVAINDRLDACEEQRDRTKNMMNDLRERLEESRNTEADLAANLREQIERRDDLKKRLAETLAAIEAQRVPGTQEIMFTTANAFIRYARIVMREPKRLLDWAAKAPSVEKIARMYWVDREEKRMKEREANAQSAQDERSEKLAAEAAKKAAKKQKREEANRIKVEKQRAAAAAEAGAEAEAAFTARFEEAKAAYDAMVDQAQKDAADRGEDADSIAIPPFSPSDLGLTMEDKSKAVSKAANMAGKAVMKEEQARIMKAEFAEAEKAMAEASQLGDIIKERERKFKEQQERRDNRISGSDIKEALKGMTTVPPDRLLLRWIKFHLRRSTRHGFPYRRKFHNFKNDIRDGVSYAVLMNKIAPETTGPACKIGGSDRSQHNLDGEIDPQVRIDVMLEQASMLNPPAVGFITRGHILGFEPFLNAAFVTRLFLTRHGFEIGETHPQMKTARDTLKELQVRWRAVMGTAQQLTDWDTWKKMRKKFRDIQLDDLLTEMKLCAADTADFVRSLEPIRRRANRGYQAWESIYDAMNGFLLQMFAIKMNQEEEAAMGTVPDKEKGHAPIQLVDYRHEVKFLKYTQTRRERIEELFQTVRDKHLRDAAQAKLEDDLGPGEELTGEQIEEIAAICAPKLSQKKTFDEIEAIEHIIREEYNELRLIFEYYAAGGEGGSAFDMSIAEFSRFCADTTVCAKTKYLDSGDIAVVFDATEDKDAVDSDAELGDEEISDEEVFSGVTPGGGGSGGAGGAGGGGGGGNGDGDGEPEYELDDEGNPKLDEEGNKILIEWVIDEETGEPKLDEEGNKIRKVAGEGGDEEEEEEEYSWTLGEDEREIVPKEWVEAIIHLGLRRYPKTESLSQRVQRIITEVIRPNACQANTETFRGELSMDEVQKVYKEYKPMLMAIFMFYAEEHPATPGNPPSEPSMDGPGWLRMMKDSKLVTRKSDVPNDLPELDARGIFMNVQMEEEEVRFLFVCFGAAFWLGFWRVVVGFIPDGNVAQTNLAYIFVLFVSLMTKPFRCCACCFPTLSYDRTVAET
jgi:hypothetical protein